MLSYSHSGAEMPSAPSTSCEVPQLLTPHPQLEAKNHREDHRTKLEKQWRGIPALEEDMERSWTCVIDLQQCHM